MVLRRGFKAEAKKIAVEVREELGITAYEPIDPYALAELYGIEVHDLQSPDLPSEAVQHFTAFEVEVFSAALLPVDAYCRVIIENHSHDRLRRRSTMAHEMSHVLLEHEFGLLLADENGCRASTSVVEREAAELSGELLIPGEAARRAAFNGWPDTRVADHFDVSMEMARWRMNASGARKIANRARSKRDK